MITYYQQRGHHALPWLIVGPGFERAFTTREAEAFVQGAEAAGEASARRRLHAAREVA